MRKIPQLALALLLFGALPAAASTLTFDLSVAFPAPTLIGAPPPWVRVTVDDNPAGGLSPNADVRITVNTGGLVGGETLNQLALNLNPAMNLANFNGFTVVSNTTAGEGLLFGAISDSFGEGNSGNYDLLLEPLNVPMGRNNTFVIDVDFSGTLLATDFGFFSTPGGAFGPFFAAGQVNFATGGSQFIGGNTACVNCGLNPILNSVAPVPEPGSLVLLGSALAAVAARRRFTSRR